ncbi:protein of unknown function [Mesotoga infera]|uniref:Uncharacterized protein n=1 Tax=Mesotoga infera TaxID=1236046 RepID=A0A7Z7LG56_9BACT|nr:protein of unknown function [Mesotoga infera]
MQRKIGFHHSSRFIGPVFRGQEHLRYFRRVFIEPGDRNVFKEILHKIVTPETVLIGSKVLSGDYPFMLVDSEISGEEEILPVGTPDGHGGEDVRKYSRNDQKQRHAGEFFSVVHEPPPFLSLS